jgi:hypothetical protein
MFKHKKTTGKDKTAKNVGLRLSTKNDMERKTFGAISNKEIVVERRVLLKDGSVCVRGPRH